jgi:hypothetical protein
MAARRYAINGQDTNTDETTILGLTSAATVRPEIYDVMCTAYGTPNDYQAKYIINRYTATGTVGAAKTPQALDPSSPSSLCSGGDAHSVEPTYTANAELLVISRNMRHPYRWVASRPGSGLILPATASNGAGVLVKEVSTAWTDNVCFHFEE